MTSVISVQISQATSIAKSFLDNYRAKTPENLKVESCVLYCPRTPHTALSSAVIGYILSVLIVSSIITILICSSSRILPI